jgi:mono/diheme cytochrome c family protein
MKIHRDARRAAVVASWTLATACAGAPPAVEMASCPAPGPRPAEPTPFAIEGDAVRGARLFLEHCQGCHATVVAMRLPDAPANAPRLDCEEWLAVADEAWLYRAINRGPGLFGHANRPPLGEHLAPMDVADLVAHLRSLAER